MSLALSAMTLYTLPDWGWAVPPHHAAVAGLGALQVHVEQPRRQDLLEQRLGAAPPAARRHRATERLDAGERALRASAALAAKAQRPARVTRYKTKAPRRRLHDVEPQDHRPRGGLEQ